MSNLLCSRIDGRFGYGLLVEIERDVVGWVITRKGMD